MGRTVNFRGRLVAVAVAGAMAATIFGGPARADNVSDEAFFVAKINDIRTARGLPQLVVDQRLVALARSWAANLAASGTLAHNPNLTNQGPAGWTVLGENVGDSGHYVQALHDAFVNSPEHMANFIDPRFTSMGIGVVVNDGLMWVAEEFMGTAPLGGVAAPAQSAAVVKPAAVAVKPPAVAAKPAPVRAAKPAPRPVPKRPATVPVRRLRLF